MTTMFRDDLHVCGYCGDHRCDCLARVLCVYAGDAGHHNCGWCTTHNRPRFQCGCLYHFTTPLPVTKSHGEKSHA
jgi:hypothetical protein